MAEPFLTEIRLFTFNFPPKGWAFCNGQFLPINQNQAMFALLGTMFGGNGQTTFALPDFRDRIPIHTGNGHTLGEKGGENSHTVSISEMPTHTHVLNGTSNSANTTNPIGAMLADTKPSELYNANDAGATMNPAVISTVGGSQAHENRQPYLTLNFCIALQGIFPSQT